MDKKYILKNWYPSLPITVEEGTVVTYVEQIYGGVYLTKQGKKISENEVENHPHFWEKVVERIIVTEDGVEISVEADQTVYVLTPEGNILLMGSIEAFEAGPSHIFSTFAAANNWVQKSTPRYSINTIREWVSKTFTDFPVMGNDEDHIKEMIVMDLNDIQNQA